MLYGWIDTPEDNWPLMLPKDLVPVGFSILERLAHNVTDIFFSAGLNKKLGTHGLNISGIAAASAEKGLKIADIMAIVEEDGWLYEGQYHDGMSMVCSSYVAALWKAAGIFGDKEVNAVEFTPKDLYELNFFDENFKRPQQCIDADPDYKWCQLLGKYRLTFPGFNTIEPYDHMNERCPSIAPHFHRPDGC